MPHTEHDVCAALPEKRPAGHAWQASEESLLWSYSPARQDRQAVAPAAADLPAEQAPQTVTFAAEYLPAAQTWHALEAVLSWSFLPAGQSWHALPACPTWPLWHPTQDVAPMPEDLPEAQFVHGVAGLPSASAVPLTQATQTEAPCAAYLPVPQLEHEVCAALAVILPAVQLVHGVEALLSASTCPTAQSTHADTPAAAYLPLPHAVQEVLDDDPADFLPAAQITHEELALLSWSW